MLNKIVSCLRPEATGPCYNKFPFHGNRYTAHSPEPRLLISVIYSFYSKALRQPSDKMLESIIGNFMKECVCVCVHVCVCVMHMHVCGHSCVCVNIWECLRMLNQFIGV